MRSSTAYFEGAEAFDKGKDWTDNPYSNIFNSPSSFTEWLAGWVNAKQHKEAKKSDGNSNP